VGDERSFWTEGKKAGSKKGKKFMSLEGNLPATFSSLSIVVGQKEREWSWNGPREKCNAGKGGNVIGRSEGGSQITS